MVAMILVRRLTSGMVVPASWPTLDDCMELIVIRHGRPERVENVAGGADPRLNDMGHGQAAAIAEWMKHEPLDAIYVSPMKRARQTSGPIEAALGIEATIDPRVREFDHTHPSYIPLEELRADKAAWKAYVAKEEASTRPEFAAEVMSGVEEIVERHRGQKVAVVCHGGVINIVAARVLGLEERMFFNPYYTSINRFMFASSGERSVVSLNDTGHLRAQPHLL